MKVCPIQKYGLGPVVDEFEKTGKILRKDTEELEAYNFMGRHYGPGERPRLEQSFFKPQGFEFDAKRTVPSAGVERPTFLM